MKDRTKLYFYALLAFLMVLDLYMIFNAGNPNSIIRPLLPDSGYDIFVTVIVSVIIMFIATFVFRPNQSDQDQVKLLLQANKAYIQKLREKGRSDLEITDSLLDELKLKRISRILVKRRILKQLSRI